MMNIKPLARLTRMLRKLLKVAIVTTSISVIVGFYHYHSYANLPADVDPNEVFLTSDHVVNVVDFVQIIMYGIVAGFFLRWQYHTIKNLNVLSGQDMDFSPGWSIACYFIPIVNLFVPLRAMKEIWRVSHRDESTTNSILVWWWILWIISGIFGYLVYESIMEAEDLNGYISLAATCTASDVLDVILLIVVLNMVTQIGEAYSRNIIEPTDLSDGDFMHWNNTEPTTDIDELLSKNA